MTSCLTFFLILSFVAVLNSWQFRCDYRFFPEADGGWLKLHRVPANWFEARLRCHLEGQFSLHKDTSEDMPDIKKDVARRGNLASPSTPGFIEAMRHVMGEATGDISSGVFTGIHAIFSRGDFHTIEGIPLWKIPHTWALGEPNNYKDEESCIAMLLDGNVADVNCNEPLPYFCYKKHTKTEFNYRCGTTDKEYVFDSRTGSCYKFHTVPRIWSRAYMTCTAEGGYLAIINSEEEAQVIKEIFAEHPSGSLHGNFEKERALVGIHDWKEHGEWLTIHGETLKEAGYDKFNDGEPNNATNGQFCGAVFRSAHFDDIWCEKSYAFICEKSPYSLFCKDEVKRDTPLK